MDKIRFLAHKINRLLEMFPAVAIVGPRQCGKSTLIKAIRPDWKYYDLERPDDYRLISSDPLGFFSRQREKTLIDVSGPLKMHEKGHVENASAGSSSTPGTWLGSGKLLHDQIFHAVAFAFDELMVGVVEEAVENG